MWYFWRSSRNKIRGDGKDLAPGKISFGGTCRTDEYLSIVAQAREAVICLATLAVGDLRVCSTLAVVTEDVKMQSRSWFSSCEFLTCRHDGKLVLVLSLPDLAQ